MRLLVAIPCLNEETNIQKVIRAIPRNINGIDKVEVLVVDDGSTDNTSEVAQAEGAKVIKHLYNKGLGCAFQTAISYAVESKADIMVNMDGDGQFDAKDIIRLIDPIIEKKADMVTASRFVDKSRIPHMPKVKCWGNLAMSRLISHLCSQRYYDVSCGFRAYSRETILKSNFHGKYTYTQEAFIFFTSQNLKIVEVAVDVKYFSDRKSRVAGNLLNYTRKTLCIILALYRDYFPMRLFGFIASFFGLIALIFGGIFGVNYIITGMFRGYLFAGLICAFSLLLMLAFLCMGISLQGNVSLRENQNRILYLLKKMGKDL